MSRAVTCDHILFDESIASFRPERPVDHHRRPGPNFSYILTSFRIHENIEFPHCTVSPSTEVQIAPPYRAFYSRVSNPEWCDGHNSHLFGVALSSLISFTTGRPCKSTYNDYLCPKPVLANYDALSLAMNFPVATSGPGSHKDLSALGYSKLVSDTAQLIEYLHKIPYPKYMQAMQAIRLVHLSLINKREDFGLAYLLLVSAIESIAQIAVPRKAVALKHEKDAHWKALAKANEDFAELLTAYKEARGGNGYLTTRYITFIRKYSPPSSWIDLVPNPWAWDESEQFTAKNRVLGEQYPDELSDEQLDKILVDTYGHRSKFVHSGTQPPHQHPTGSDRFFEEQSTYDGESRSRQTLATYELMLAIAQSSITKWIKE